MLREPLKGKLYRPYKGAIEASEKDTAFYDLLCLCDALRIGRLREKQKAKELLEERIEKHKEAV